MDTDSAFSSFHEGLIDYAGLFPPAGLPFGEAIDNYVSYLESDDSWMLGSFVLPLAKLDALKLWMQQQSGLPRLCFSVLPVSPLDDAATFLASLTGGLEALSALAGELKHPVSVLAWEVRVAATELKSIREHADLLLGLADKHGAPAVYVEPADPSSWELWADVAQEVGLAMKLRCGGVEAHMIPSVELVAERVAYCASRLVPLKYTAGLHHPMRAWSEAHQAPLHGYWNIFAATMMARVHRLEAPLLAEILREESADSVEWSAEGLRWRNYQLSVEEIRSARAHVAHSYGSCSFDEPRADMRALNWI